MTSFVRRTARLATVVLGGAVLAACQSSIDSPDAAPIGVLQIDVNGDATPTRTVPTVTFVRAYGLTLGNTQTPGDQCSVLGLDESPQTPSAVAGVSAGEALSLALSGTTTQLVPTEQSYGRVYAPASQATVTFQPGDSAKVTIPGAQGGFPAATFAIKTAETVIFSAIPAPANMTTADLPLAWNAGDDNSAMLISLRYQVPNEASPRQVLCAMEDDGAFTVPEEFLSGWKATTSTNRRVVATRVRNNGVSLSGAKMYGSTTFRKTVTITSPTTS
jgi:Tfp pilus assembly protein PilW